MLPVLAAILLAACAGQQRVAQDEFTISILGTNDVHGQLLPSGERAGLVAVSGYINALRAARREDGGAVLVIDAGDMWQGTLESNLVEGAAVVEAYNSIGFDAAAVGNHEFDFGPLGKKAIPADAGDDARGALKQRATEADFPLLAANLIDETTGLPVDWDNVRPSVMLDVQGVKVGVVGVMTSRALQTTISANTPGLSVAPLAPTIHREADKLREQGATIMIVAAHAGGTCTAFDDPADLASCDMEDEIMRVASALPPGLVDHIVAGHVHKGIAHVVNGISITSSYSSARAFSRVDLEVSRQTGTVVSRTVHPPHWSCLYRVTSTGQCADLPDGSAEIVPAVYEGREITPDPAIVEIAERAAAFAAKIKDEKLGVWLESGFDQPPATESPLANLMTDALLDASGADIAVHNVVGGIRNTLPEGELTFGAVYEMFPFDNRVVLLQLSGRELRELVATQAHNHGRRMGFSGMRVFVDCTNNAMDVVMQRTDGSAVRDDDRVTVLANDYLTLGGDDILTPVIPAGGFPIDDSMPLVRDLLVDWFRARGGTLEPGEFLSTSEPRWNVAASLTDACVLQDTGAESSTTNDYSALQRARSGISERKRHRAWPPAPAPRP